MKKISAIAAVSALALLTACGGSGGGGKKKVVIMSSGKMTVAGNTVTLDPGGQHNEQELAFTDKEVALTVKSGEKTQTYNFTEDGVYLLNLKTDTMIGGLVNYGSTGMPTSITGEQLDRIIDSTQQLMRGQNASDEKKTYFLPPFALKRITGAEQARLIGPFKGIPGSVENDGSGKPPEIYKFFTNKQKAETLSDLMKQKSEL